MATLAAAARRMERPTNEETDTVTRPTNRRQFLAALGVTATGVAVAGDVAVDGFEAREPGLSAVFLDAVGEVGEP